MRPGYRRNARAAGDQASALSRKFNDISVAAGRCKRTRYRKSDCHRCGEVCPENAISFDPGPVISESCIECGLCVTACPTGGFRDERQRERDLLKRALLVRPGENKSLKSSLAFHCHRIKQSAGNSLSILCLGNLTAHFIALLAASGCENFTFTMGKCLDCRVKHGEGLLHQSVRTALALMEGMGRVKPKIQVQMNSQNWRKLDRRTVFLSSFVDVFANVQQAFHGAHSDGFPRRFTCRDMLGSVLAESSRLPRTKYSRDLPWGGLAIDEKRCSACGICASVCPTAALIETDEGERKVLHFHAAACVNCRLCIDACAEGCIHFEEFFSLQSVIQDKTEVLARVSQPRCGLCGTTMRAARGGLCPACEKRALRSTFIPQAGIYSCGSPTAATSSGAE